MKFFLLIPILISCVHSQFDKALEKQQCEKALELAEGINVVEKTLAEGSQATRILIKYTIQAGTYAGEVIIIPMTTALRTTTILVVCASAPLLVFSFSHIETCVVGLDNIDEWFLKRPESAQNIRDEIEGIDRLDLSPLAKNMRLTSKCYASRNTKPDLILSRNHLMAFKENPALYRHISNTERQKIEDLLSQVSKKLTSY